MHVRIQNVARRLRLQWPFVLQATFASTVAWILDTQLLHHPQPFFAPAASLIVLNQARGQRMRRALDVWVGVAAGVLIADVVAQVLGRGSTFTVLVVVFVTLVASVGASASPVVMVQATVSALYVVIVTPSVHSVLPLRFLDALIGGGVALVVSQFVALRDPLAPLKREVSAMFNELPSVVDDLVSAIETNSEETARAAYVRAIQMNGRIDNLNAAATAAGESLLFHHDRREQIGVVRSVEDVGKQIDFLVQSTRGLARTVILFTRKSAVADVALVQVVRELASATTMTGKSLEMRLAGRYDEAKTYSQAIVEHALRAVEASAVAVNEHPSIAATIVIGQVRMMAIDLVRVAMGDDRSVLDKVDEAFGASLI